MNPLVSIIIPTHRPDHFVNAIACALGQTYQNIEIIVSDNSDSNEVKNICQKYPNVIYRKNSDGVPASNISKPLSLVSGDYIKYIFDDDLIYPHCIDSMIGWLYKIDESIRNDIGIVTSSRHLIDSNSTIYGELREKKIDNVTLVKGINCIKRILIAQDNFIGEFSTVMFNAKFIDFDNPMNLYYYYDEKYQYGLFDVLTYLKILKKSNLLYIPHSLSAFRKHSDAGSDPVNNTSFHIVVSDWFRLIETSLKIGLISEGDSKVAFKNYIQLSSHFEKLYPEQLSKFREMARMRM